MKNNILVIGMAGVGKTFNSKILAERLGYGYVCADEVIEERALGMGIKNIKLMSDPDFIALESKILLELVGTEKKVIDTGGSAIYSTEAMDLLKKECFVVYLYDDASIIKDRFDKRDQFNVIVGMKDGPTAFQNLLAEREPLYEKYADIKVDVSEHKDDLVDFILSKINLGV